MIPYVDYPLALAATPVVALAIGLLVVLAYRRRARRLRRIGADAVVSRLLPAMSQRSPWRRALVLGLAAACAGVAFAGPRWGTERLLERGSGVDVVLAMDASLSMLAPDEHPSRLESMKDEARRLLAMSGGDRFGLIAFAGRSYILTPLTVDQGALALFLDNLDPSVVGEAGTSLSRAIRQGTDLLLATPTASDRALVIMSDGEAFEPMGDITAAAQRAADSGIAVITVGFGTQRGSTIPIRTSQGITQKRDVSGQVVVTHYTPETLAAIARTANGTFIDAGATDKATRIRRALSALRRQARTTESGRESKPRFQLFLVPALLLALLDTVLAERRRRTTVAPPGTVAKIAAVLVLGMLVLPVNVRAGDTVPKKGGVVHRGDDADRLFRAGRFREAAAEYDRMLRSGHDSPRLEYNFGTALIAAGHPDDAIDPLERAAQLTTDPDVRYRALFNLGAIYLRRARASKGSDAAQAFTAAAAAYKRVLRLRPSDVDAKWNYELANRQNHGGGGGGGGGAQQQPQSGESKQNAPPQGGTIDRQQAERLLNSAAREEREVQAKKQRENQPETPPGGKDW